MHYWEELLCSEDRDHREGSINSPEPRVREGITTRSSEPLHSCLLPAHLSPRVQIPCKSCFRLNLRGLLSDLQYHIHGYLLAYGFSFWLAFGTKRQMFEVTPSYFKSYTSSVHMLGILLLLLLLLLLF